jgi:hypothetical protein
MAADRADICTEHFASHPAADAAAALVTLPQNDLVLLKLQSAEQACDLAKAAAAQRQMQQQLEQAR